MFTVAVPRMGRPPAVKRVYLTVTELTYAVKLVSAPQWKITQGGLPFFFWWLSSVGTQQAKSCSTVFTTRSSCVSLASRNISSESLLGSAPVNCGTSLFLLPFCDCRFHFADLLRESSFGLNWNSIRPRGGPGCRLFRSTGGSRSSRKPWWAISTVSVATLGESGFSDGPVHRTGTTSSSPHVAMGLPPPVMAWMDPVVLPAADRGPRPAIVALNHAATCSVDRVSGRLS